MEKTSLPAFFCCILLISCLQSQYQYPQETKTYQSQNIPNPLPKPVYQEEIIKTLPTIILGQNQKTARPDLTYGTAIDGLKTITFYDYTDFYIRIIEFDSVYKARLHLVMASKTQNAKTILGKYVWRQGPKDFIFYSNLAYMLGPAKVIMIFPKQSEISMAHEIAREINK